MLNNNNERELAYLAQVTDIIPIEGAERVEIAKIQGWTCLVAKNDFKVGDIGIFFEADSKLPAKEPFMFLESKGFKVKTQKYFRGTVISDGLLMKISAFDEYEFTKVIGENAIISKDGIKYCVDDETRFLTKLLDVKYSTDADNDRKSNRKEDKDVKYKRMMRRHPKLAKSKFGRFCMKHQFTKDLLYKIFGRKPDSIYFPYWVKKTDEERIQNLAHMIPMYRKEKWIATEKVDGTSATFTIKKYKNKFGKMKNEYCVCSRNVRYDADNLDNKINSKYDTNVYLKIAEKYNLRQILEEILNSKNILDFVTIQGEIYGRKIQKRDYGKKEPDLAIFNVIFGMNNGIITRLNPIEMRSFLNKYKLPSVPIIKEDIELPETCDEILEMATGKSKIDGGKREGIVFRSYDGKKSFKSVSKEYLMKYH